MKNFKSKNVEEKQKFMCLSKNNNCKISIKQQINDLINERNALQKVFDKYGYDIINDADKYQIIHFGNECRDALNIVIE